MKKFTKRLKRLKDDERGVSPVVGFVLIFALIMIVFTLYQSSVVPAQNEQVEFKHSQVVENDMSRLNDAIQQAGATGVPQSSTVTTGVQYPDRALAINPGAPTGTLKASKDTYEVSFKNVRATSDDVKYFDPASHPDAFTFESKELIYGIGYNVYQQDPTVTIAPGLQFAEFHDGAVVQSTDIISGNSIGLTLLDPNSEYQQSTATTSVGVKSTSSATEYMTVEPTGGTPKITIETSLSLDGTQATNFENRLVEENDKVTSASYAGGTVTLTLKSEPYQLRVAEVGVGTGDKPAAHYLVSDSPTIQTLSLGEAATFTVTARDELGNPVPGADVTAVVDAPNSGGTGTFESSPSSPIKTTNENGQATFSFRPNTVTADPITVDVTLDSGGGGPDLSKVTYTVEADTRQGFIDNGYGIDVTVDSVDLSGDQLEIVFENTRGEQVTATTMQLNGFLSKKNKPVTSATLGSTSIAFNKGPVALGGDEFSVPSGGSKTVILNLNDKPNGVGLLIVDITFESTSGQTLTATYATSVDDT